MFSCCWLKQDVKPNLFSKGWHLRRDDKAGFSLNNKAPHGHEIHDWFWWNACSPTVHVSVNPTGAFQLSILQDWVFGNIAEEQNCRASWQSACRKRTGWSDASICCCWKPHKAMIAKLMKLEAPVHRNRSQGNEMIQQGWARAQAVLEGKVS